MALICSDPSSFFILLPPPSLLIDLLKETYNSLFPLFPPGLLAPFCPLPFPCPRPHGGSSELLFLQYLQFLCSHVLPLHPQRKVPYLDEAGIYTWITKADWENSTARQTGATTVLGAPTSSRRTLSTHHQLAPHWLRQCPLPSEPSPTFHYFTHL